jgi:putative DNA primase/helicase
VNYDPTATLPLWDDFLATVTNEDIDLALFLRRCAGYSLTGSTLEEKLFFVHGPTATGKSTFIEALKATLGDYAQTADFETFLSRSQGGGPRNDIAGLAGSRFVASIEVDKGRRLAEGLVKQLTGGDTVHARFLYHEGFSFKPAFKLWLSANDAPRASDDDSALWRRILRVPFEHSIPGSERDPSVKARLTDPAIAGAAILAWAVEGCRDWQVLGLRVPERVKAATESYRQEQDPLKDFFSERCIFMPKAETKASELWRAYRDWAAENGERWPVTRQDFVKRLTARGCVERRGAKGVRFWRGVGLLLIRA